MFRYYVDKMLISVNFEDFNMNRCVHTRTLEGDDEKPSHHDNEGLLLILSFYFCIMMDVSERPGSPKSWNSKAS